MSSVDFRKVLIRDSRTLVESEIAYGVYKGASQMTPYTSNAVSQSTSQVTFNVQVPSQETIVDRRVLWHSTLTFTFTTTNQVNGDANGIYPFSYGLFDALAPWPLHNLCTTMSSTINSNTVTLNSRDVIPQLTRLYDQRQLAAYNGMTPVKPDFYQSYGSATNGAVSSIFNVLGDANSCLTDSDLPPRGAFKVTSINRVKIPAGATSPANNAQCTITIDVVEPLMLSPWMFVQPKSNGSGLVGIQTLLFVFNLDPQCTRVWRSTGQLMTDNGAVPPAVPVYSVANNTWASLGVKVALTNCTNNYLEFNFLTPSPSMMIPRRNIVPFYEAPFYSVANGNNPINAGTSADIVSQTISLSVVPDKLLVQVRKSSPTLTYTDADWAFVINNISISWNNNVGILSSAKPEDLYRYTREAGSNISWAEFSGAVNSTSAGGVAANVKTVGSFLMLDFGRHINLNEDYLAPGVLGQFVMQLKLNVTNQAAVAVVPEISICTINSGIFISEAGSSAAFTGILDKAAVLEASSQSGYGSLDAERLVGGGFLDMLKGSVAKILPKLPSVAKAALSGMDDPRAKKGAEVLGALGYGSSGAGLSGAGRPRFVQ